jgi:integrase
MRERKIGWIERRGARWLARWRDHEGKHSLSFPTEALARDHLAHLASLIVTAPHDAHKMTVAQLLREYIEQGHATERWAPSTVGTYRQKAEAHIIPYLGDLRMQSLTIVDVQRWADTLARKKLSPSVVQSAHAILSGAYADAMRLGMVAGNPCTRVRLRKKRHVEADFWTVKDLHKVFLALEDEPYWSALYVTAIATGMRPGELRGLQWADVDMEEATLTIRATMTRDEENRQVLGRTTKTGKTRRVAMPALALDALAALPRTEGPVFARNGRPLAPTTWDRYHRGLCARAGVKRIRLHDLRHTSASLDLLNRTHHRLVQERLGHASFRETMDRYTHVITEDTRSAADNLALLIRPVKRAG